MDPGRCPMCGKNWDGRYESSTSIPENLPKPEDGKWLNQLQNVLNREILSREQYETDSRKFNLRMPYMRVIPDEQNHIAWIEQLFKSYGVPIESDVPPVQDINGAQKAYEVARGLEQDLIPDYEWLIQNTADPNSQQVIETILFQTRMHHTMFDHALRMGGMMRQGMGRGMIRN